MTEVTIEEIQKLFEYYNTGSTTLDIFYNIVTFMMLIVSVFSFRVAWKVYRQSGIMHKENMELTRKMHADSLTPYVVIKSVRNCITFVTDRFPEMKIEKIEISDSISLNDVAEVNVSELKGKIYIEVNIFNMSDMPAEVKIKYSCLGYEKEYNEYLVGKEEKVIKIENDILEFRKEKLNEVINSCIDVLCDVSYKGPGMSAIDTLSGQMKLFYRSKGDAINSVMKQLERKRKYE